MAGALPVLDTETIRDTRDALHAYARVVGNCLKASRVRRKHWWHASLRPSLNGLTSGVIYGEPDYELELDFRHSRLVVRSPDRDFAFELDGANPEQAAEWQRGVLTDIGIDTSTPADGVPGEDRFSRYSTHVAADLQSALSRVTAAMQCFRAGIREEVSPIQLWPHHFDLSMIWLPGNKIPGKDPEDEEHADKQMNFGFVFGDETIDEPYFYITAYPLPAEIAAAELPDGTAWKSDGFNGAVLLYRDLAGMNDPTGYLLELWSGLYAAGKRYLANDD